MTMSILSAEQRDKLEGSFSFSYNDFSSSSLGIYFSDGEENCSDTDSYIEIQVQQPKHRTPQHGRTSAKDFAFGQDHSGLHGDDDEEEDDDDHIELRISISSSVPFPQISSQCFNDAIEARIGLSGKAGLAGDSDEKSSLESSVVVPRNGTKGRRIQFTAIKRILSTLSSNLKVSPEICHAQEKDVFNVLSKRKNKNFRLLRPSNSARALSQATEKGITKFLIKIRAMQIRPFLSSVLKNWHVSGSKTKLGNKNKARNRAIEDTVQCYRRVSSKVSRQSSLGKSQESRDDSLLGPAMNVNTRSCPSSINSSPINRTHSNRDGKGYLGENSIQAAIAHCKSSFSPFPGFTFQPYV